MAKVNNFTNAGSISLTSGGPAVGDTIYNVTIDGVVLDGNSSHPNHLKGGAGNDMLIGGSSHDTLIGAAGDDVLTGSAGADIFQFGSGSGHDVVTDFGAGDSLKMADVRHGVGVKLVDTGSDTIIQLSTGDSVTLIGVHLSDLAPTSSGYVHA